MNDFERRARNSIQKLFNSVANDPTQLEACDLLSAVGLLNEAILEIDRLDNGIREVLDIPYRWCFDTGEPVDKQMIAALLELLGATPKQADEESKVWKKEQHQAIKCPTCLDKKEIFYFFERAGSTLPVYQLISCPDCVAHRNFVPKIFTTVTTASEETTFTISTRRPEQ